MIGIWIEKSDGTAIPSPLRVGITANNHDRRQNLRIRVSPAAEATNITLAVTNKLQLSDQQQPSGGNISFKVVGTDKSDNPGDQTITATHTGHSVTASTPVSVVVPAKIATPHDITGTLVIANRGLNTVTSPADHDIAATQVKLYSTYNRYLTDTNFYS